MLDLDPLQHHGWFVLTEADLKFYCNAYFGAELFNHSKSLLNNKKPELTLNLRDSAEEIFETFVNMVIAIIRKLEDMFFKDAQEILS